jgi:LssY C-terminus
LARHSAQGFSEEVKKVVKAEGWEGLSPDSQARRHTRRFSRYLCALLVCAASPVVSARPAIPFAGTKIEARLLTPISSYNARPHMPVEAVVTTQVCAAGNNPPVSGAILRGEITKVHRVGLGLVHETALIGLDFGTLALSDTKSYPVKTRLTAIDNARERVDSHGVLHGIRATATLSNRAGERLAFLAMGHPLAMLPLFAESAMFHFPDPEIELIRGADFHLTVEFPPELGEVTRCAVTEEISDDEWAELHSVVDSLPYWTYSKRQRQPLDPVNLVFVGSQEEIGRSFSAAGWIGSRPNSVHAGLKAIRAIAENHALADAPMRTLLLDGIEPDMQLQKSMDTFEKRDHLRIWFRDGEFDGRQVWASAATRDLAAVFSMRPFGFTHQIQDDVDLERDQVVSDLAFTGCVDSVAYVARLETIRHSGEAYRKGVYTDSRVAVVSLNSCLHPAEDLSASGSLPRPPKLTRWIRRVTLTARNHYLRDNMIWRGGDAIRLTFNTVRSWERERKNEKKAEIREAGLAAHPNLRQDYAVSQ